MLVVEVHDTWSSVEALSASWNGLLQASSADTIFLTWEWITAWRESAGVDGSPYVIAVRDETGLVGLAPFYLTRHALGHALPYRALRVLGDYPTGAEYGNWIVRRDRAEAASKAIAEALYSGRRDWDCAWLRNVSGWTGATDTICRRSAEAGLLCRVRPKTFAFTRLPRSSEAFRHALSSNKKQQLKSELKRLGKREGAHVVRCRSSDEVPRFLEALFDLHHRRRLVLGDQGSFLRRPAQAEFYRRFIPVALARGWLSMFAVEDGPTLRAVQLGYVYNGVFHQMQEGFDPEYLKGVGNVLRAHIIDECIAEGVTDMDFLGTMTENKRRWLAVAREGGDIFLGTPSIVNRLLFKPPVWPRALLRTLRS